MASRKPYFKKLAGFEYVVLPKVYKGGTDTELFCKMLEVKKGQDVWDIGTGTGLIALQAKKKGARYVLATDSNPSAVINSRRNSKILGLKIDTKLANVFGNIDKRFDLVTFNPPFTDRRSTKDFEASFWDKDHKTVRNFFSGIGRHLKPHGRAFIAWSSFGNTLKLGRIAKRHGFTLKKIGRKKGKRNFVYYVFELVRPPGLEPGTNRV